MNRFLEISPVIVSVDVPQMQVQEVYINLSSIDDEIESLVSYSKSNISFVFNVFKITCLCRMNLTAINQIYFRH